MVEEMELDILCYPNIDPETGETIEDNYYPYRPVDEERVNNVLNALGEAVRPGNPRRDRLRDSIYYSVHDVRKQKMESGLSRADRQTAGDFIRTRPDQEFEMDAGEVDRRTPTPSPEPRPPVINSLEDRSGALQRIRDLMDELDEIINSEPTSSHVANGRMEYRDSTIDIDTLNSCLLEVINTPM